MGDAGTEIGGNSPSGHDESAKQAPNVELNIVTMGHFQPYWEETKPYEMADFYKYSTKHRKPSGGGRDPNESGQTPEQGRSLSPSSYDEGARQCTERLVQGAGVDRLKMAEPRGPPDGMA